MANRPETVAERESNKHIWGFIIGEPFIRCAGMHIMCWHAYNIYYTYYTCIIYCIYILCIYVYIYAPYNNQFSLPGYCVPFSS